jgi:hypothetical protein
MRLPVVSFRSFVSKALVPTNFAAAIHSTYVTLRICNQARGVVLDLHRGRLLASTHDTDEGGS